MTRWEYLEVEVLLTNPRLTIRVINEYGADGWEMVSSFPAPDSEVSVMMYFKRPIQAEKERDGALAVLRDLASDGCNDGCALMKDHATATNVCHVCKIERFLSVSPGEDALK